MLIDFKCLICVFYEKNENICIENSLSMVWCCGTLRLVCFRFQFDSCSFIIEFEWTWSVWLVFYRIDYEYRQFDACACTFQPFSISFFSLCLSSASLMHTACGIFTANIPDKVAIEEDKQKWEKNLFLFFFFRFRRSRRRFGWATWIHRFGYLMFSTNCRIFFGLLHFQSIFFFWHFFGF